MSGSSSLSHSARCVCTPSRLKYHGCLCGAEMERRRRGIRPDNCVAEKTLNKILPRTEQLPVTPSC